MSQPSERTEVGIICSNAYFCTLVAATECVVWGECIVSVITLADDEITSEHSCGLLPALLHATLGHRAAGGTHWEQ